MHKAMAVQWLLLLSIIFLATTIKVTVATKYSSQIIAVMGNSEIERKAANFLYGKNPGVSTLISWNDNSTAFEYKKGKILGVMDYYQNLDLDLRKVRIQVVGHGDIFGGDDTLSGKSPKQIAEALYKIYETLFLIVPNLAAIARISLVCCNCTYNSPNAGESFATDLITELKQSYRITDTSVSARNYLVSIDSTGRKLTGTMDSNDKITWRHEDPKAVKVYNLIGGQFHYSEDNYTYEGDPITCRRCGIVTHGLALDNENGLTESVRLDIDECPSVNAMLTQKALYDTLDGITREIFDNAAKDENGLWYRTASEQRFIVRERQYIQPYIYDTERRARVINSVQDLVNEINYFGRRGPVPYPESKTEYYKFGDFITSMNTHFFTSGDPCLGVVLTEVPQNEPEPLPVDRLKELVAKSPYNWLRKEHIPENDLGTICFDLMHYFWVTGMDDDFFNDMKAFMTGNNSMIKSPNFNNKESTLAKIKNVQKALALTLSESIKNFRAHIVNMIAVDLNQHNLLNHDVFFYSHPMARWGTWPDDLRGPNYPRPTGYDGTYGQYSWDDLGTNLLDDYQRGVALTVRQRMANFLAQWLSHLNDENLKVETKKGVVYLECSDPSQDLKVHVIDDWNDVDSNEIYKAIYSAIMNVTQNLHNNASASIVDNPNVNGAFLAANGKIDTPEIEVVNQGVEQLAIAAIDSRAHLSIEGARGSDDIIPDGPGDDILLGNERDNTIILSKGYDVAKGGPGFDTYDLSEASGTKTIVNFADDLKNDVVLMSYANKSSIRYDRFEFNLIVRVAFPDYPKDYFIATKPTVIIYDWFLGNEYQHIEITAYDGVIIQELIEAHTSHLVGFQDLFNEDEL